MRTVLPNAPLFLVFCIHCTRKSISCTLKIASEAAICHLFCHLSGPTATALSPLDCHNAAPWISLPPPLPPTLMLCPSARVVQLNMSGPLSPLLRTFQGPHSLTWKTIFLCDSGSLFPSDVSPCSSPLLVPLQPHGLPVITSIPTGSDLCVFTHSSPSAQDGSSRKNRLAHSLAFSRLCWATAPSMRP